MSGRLSVVTIGGGSGQFSMLSALRDITEVSVTAVVSMTDSGGSTGKLRDELGSLPPGDVLKCILALSPHRGVARELLLNRFTRSERLSGHNAGNMLLTMLSQYAGSFPDGINALAEILNVEGLILPVTTDKATLVAKLTNGEHIYGERAIDIPRGDQREKIEDVFLVPHHADEISVYPPVLEAIQDADVIIIGPGDLYTSIVPNLLVPGVADAIRESGARLLYVTNLMTKFGETERFNVEDFIAVLQRYTGRTIPEVLYNSSQPSAELLERYRGEKADMVTFREEQQSQTLYVHAHDLLEASNDVIRHDPDKLCNAVRSLLFNSEFS